jgi:hypothetical protein
MATVKAFEIAGLKLWFWSNDHDPPHFHAKRNGEWEVKIRFMHAPSDMIEVKWSTGKISAKALKSLRSLAEKHRVALLAEWEEVQNS